ncbi:hypothetical protein [Lysinibacillus sp. K60]|uniref:hypothetical protein n=1 Tax=Lysinibacillus sp. K60 TaxID=2720027 RepID=UPI001C8CDF9C|nr:hypothetical protein [Lysinibacillus sp. K60]MBX8946021.1 hypothetical protein [Lysinibacillus sp. K60]
MKLNNEVIIISKLVRKSNGFVIRYKHYLKNSITNNTNRNIERQKDQSNSKLFSHILTYDNVNQTILGSYIFKLLKDATLDPHTYRSERLQVLQDIYQYISSNNSWYDLWKTAKSIEEHAAKKNVIIDHQTSTELLDMIRLNIPYPNFIMGLNDDLTPIIRKPTFYITEKTLNYIEHDNVGRKRGKELYNIQTSTAEFSSYLIHSFGLYRESHLDLLSQNGIRNEEVNNIKFPRKLTTIENIVKFIENNRHFTMNPNGVVIDCFNCGDIDQVILFEQEGYILWKVIFKQKGIKLNHKGDLVEDGNGAEYCGYFSHTFFARSPYAGHITFIDFEFEVYAFVLECYADIICGSSRLNKEFNRDSLNVSFLEIQSEETATVLDNKMGFRYMPRTVYKRVKANTKSKDEYNLELKKYFIAGHIRKLPDGHRPSEDAVLHAQEFGIELPENHTFVRPYETGEEKLRSHYRKKI